MWYVSGMCYDEPNPIDLYSKSQKKLVQACSTIYEIFNVSRKLHDIKFKKIMKQIKLSPIN